MVFSAKVYRFSAFPRFHNSLNVLQVIGYGWIFYMYSVLQETKGRGNHCISFDKWKIINFQKLFLTQDKVVILEGLSIISAHNE
jgi:hypothetical protein